MNHAGTLQASASPLSEVDLGIPFEPKIPNYAVSLTTTVIRKTARGISPGLIGWRNEFLKELLVYPEAVDGLYRLICQVASGYTPRTLRAVMLMDYATPSSKSWAPRTVTLSTWSVKVRPIEGADTTRKLATRSPITIEKEATAQHLQPFPMAMRVPGGAGGYE